MMKKNVFITGVLSRFGAVMAKTFRENGFYVYGVDSREDFHGNCDRFFRFEINDFVQDAGYRIRFTQIFEEIIPKLEVLINNTSVLYPDKLDYIKLEDWQTSLNVNLTGPLLLSKLFLSRLESSKGCIINVTGVPDPLEKPGLLAYNASESAMIGLTNALALDLEGRIRVNSIHPALGSMDFKEDYRSENFLNGNVEITKSSLMTEHPGDVARLALLLATSGALHGSNVLLKT